MLENQFFLSQSSFFHQPDLNLEILFKVTEFSIPHTYNFSINVFIYLYLLKLIQIKIIHVIGDTYQLFIKLQMRLVILPFKAGGIEINIKQTKV